ETEQARSAKEEPSIPEAYEPKLENATDPEPLDLTVEEEPAVANGADAPAQDADEEEEYDESDQAESAYGSLSGLRQVPPSQPAAPAAGEAEEPAPKRGQDELLLDASRLAEQDDQVTPLAARREAAPTAAPQPQTPRSPVAGSTLFERM